MKLAEHQETIVTEDKKKCGIFTTMGSGKTAVALHLAKGKTLVICKKQQYLDKTFERNAEKFNLELDLTVVSKEKFKKMSDELLLTKWDTIIYDEFHRIASGIYPDTVTKNKKRIPKMSQLFKSAYDFIKQADPERLYLLSATPAAKPMRVFAIARFLGYDWDFFSFREKFYFQREISNHRTIWEARNTKSLNDELIVWIKKFGYTGSMKDWFDVPEQTHKEEYLELTEEQEKELEELSGEEFDPLILAGQGRAIENGIRYNYDIIQENGIETMKRVTKHFDNQKEKRILELAKTHKRMLIFARFTGQIEQLESVLKSEGYNVVTLTGKTKNRGNILLEADKKDCIVIAQAAISEGYELTTFRTIVFASKSPFSEDYIQSLGRTLRMNALHPNLFIHLIVKGGADERCHKSIMSGHDFQEKLSTSNY